MLFNNKNKNSSNNILKGKGRKERGMKLRITMAICILIFLSTISYATNRISGPVGGPSSGPNTPPTFVGLTQQPANSYSDKDDILNAFLKRSGAKLVDEYPENYEFELYGTVGIIEIFQRTLLQWGFHTKPRDKIMSMTYKIGQFRVLVVLPIETDLDTVNKINSILLEMVKEK